MSSFIPPASSYDTPSRPTTPPLSAPAISSSPTANRSTTFPSKAKSHITHRLHHHHQHHHHHHHHQRDKSIPQSAAASIPASLHAFGESLTALTKIGNGTRGAVEEEKVMVNDGGEQEQEEEEGEEEEWEKGPMERMRKKRQEMGEREMWKKVEEKKEDRRKTHEALHYKLDSLTTLSTSTTRRLDYTYYSLLTHLSTLSTLVSQLSELSSTSASLITSFDTKSSHLLSTHSAQISNFNAHFDEQVTHIAEFEHRLNRGRDSVTELGSRLDGVRKKVQREERREKEGEDRVRRRLRILWGTLGAGLVLFLVLGIVRCWPGRGEDIDRRNTTAAAAAEYARIEVNTDTGEKKRSSSGIYETTQVSKSAPKINQAFASSSSYSSSSSSHAESYHQDNHRQQQLPVVPSSSSPHITDQLHPGVDTDADTDTGSEWARESGGEKKVTTTMTSTAGADLVFKSLDEL